jgi:hypothetical protein
VWIVVESGKLYRTGVFQVNKPIRLMIPLLILMMLIVACQPSAPAQQFQTGAEIATYNFSEGGTFEEGSYTGSETSLRIIDGVYRINIDTGDNELWWGQWGDTLGDVVVDVDVEQKTERNENAYGVGCRMAGTVGQVVELDATMAAIANSSVAEVTAEPEEVATSIAETSEATESTAEATEAATEEATSEATEEATETEEPAIETETEEATAEATEELAEGGVSQVPASRLTDTQAADGDGYLFLMQGNGQFAIMRSRNRSLTPLVDWRASSEINQGVARNQLRAVCVGNYLAFYINGKFVADATDDTYSSGQVALLASAANRLGVRVEFDNLNVSEGEAS